MTHLYLLTEVARVRREEFLRQADERRLAAAMRAIRGQQEHNSDPFLSRLRFARSIHRHHTSQASARA